MDRDTVIALAREAGLDTNDSAWLSIRFERFAALVEERLKSQGYRQCAKGQRTTQFCGMLDEAVKAEREACAKVCEELRDDWLRGLGRYEFMGEGADYCADAIRSRE